MWNIGIYEHLHNPERNLNTDWTSEANVCGILCFSNIIYLTFWGLLSYSSVSCRSRCCRIRAWSWWSVWSWRTCRRRGGPSPGRAAGKRGGRRAPAAGTWPPASRRTRTAAAPQHGMGPWSREMGDNIFNDDWMIELERNLHEVAVIQSQRRPLQGHIPGWVPTSAFTFKTHGY